MAPVSDQRHPHLQRLSRMLGQWQAEASQCHFSDHLPVLINVQRNKFPHLPKRLQAGILIGAQHGDERPSCLDQLRQELCRHALAIHDNTPDALQVSRLLIGGEDRWQSTRQMGVSPMGRDQQGVALLIVQEHERGTPGLFPCTRSARGG
jgi:hypothetical protein